MPEPEFWMLLFVCEAIGTIPGCLGGALFGLGVRREVIALKITGGCLLGIGALICLPMRLLLAMWIIAWIVGGGSVD
jgi:hypothetical protein